MNATNRSQTSPAYFAFYGVGDNKLTGQGEPERLSGVPVSQNFFPFLGVQPQLGRQFSAAECKWNGPKAVMLSHGLWERRFASDPDIVGKPLTLNGEAYTVVGVMPPSFDFGSIFAPGAHIDLYFPFPLSKETDRWGNTLALVGRLKPGVSIQAAQAEASVLGELIHEKKTRTKTGWLPRLSFLAKHVSGRVRPGADGVGLCGRRGDVDCMRQPFELIAGENSNAAKRNGHSRRTRSRAEALDSSITDGEH